MDFSLPGTKVQRNEKARYRETNSLRSDDLGNYDWVSRKAAYCSQIEGPTTYYFDA